MGLPRGLEVPVEQWMLTDRILLSPQVTAAVGWRTDSSELIAKDNRLIRSLSLPPLTITTVSTLPSPIGIHPYMILAKRYRHNSQK